MLVVISDLHFIDETTGKHNIPPGAFQEVFLSDIASLAKNKRAKEIKLLLLGDIVDLVRTEQWFQEGPDDRPWGKNGLADIPVPNTGSNTEKRCLSILGQMPPDGRKPETSENTILSRNWDALEFFRNFQTLLEDRHGVRLPVRTVYVPGNHDRLCNLYPSVRNWMKDAFGLTIDKDTVDGNSDSWWYRYDFMDEKYGVYARHGHQFDPINYGGENDHTRPAQLKASIGEIFATEFAAKLPYILKRNGKANKALVAQLEEIDNVRPLGSIVEWLYYQVKFVDQGSNREALEDAFKIVVNEILDIDFVKKWKSSKTNVDEVLRAASSSSLRWLTNIVIDAVGAEYLLPIFIGGSESSTAPEKDNLARGAYYEQIWKSNHYIQLLLYGHTHVPLQVPLGRLDSREVLYINTGTWRDRIYRALKLDQPPDFMTLKQMTYVVVYSDEEDLEGKSPGTISFDVWTGQKRKSYAE